MGTYCIDGKFLEKDIGGQTRFGTVLNFSKSEIIKYLHVNENKIKIIGIGKINGNEACIIENFNRGYARYG